MLYRKFFITHLNTAVYTVSYWGGYTNIMIEATSMIPVLFFQPAILSCKSDPVALQPLNHFYRQRKGDPHLPGPTFPVPLGSLRPIWPAALASLHTLRTDIVPHTVWRPKLEGMRISSLLAYLLTSHYWHVQQPNQTNLSLLRSFGGQRRDMGSHRPQISPKRGSFTAHAITRYVVYPL